MSSIKTRVIKSYGRNEITRLLEEQTNEQGSHHRIEVEHNGKKYTARIREDGMVYSIRVHTAPSIRSGVGHKREIHGGTPVFNAVAAKAKAQITNEDGTIAAMGTVPNNTMGNVVGHSVHHKLEDQNWFFNRHLRKHFPQYSKASVRQRLARGLDPYG